MRLGAHVSASGGVDKAIDRAQEMGAETIQMFASSPRAWAFRPVSEDHASEFRRKSLEAGVAPTFLHGSYLVNVGGDADIVAKSVESLTLNLAAASALAAKGVIFHGGSHKGKGFDAVLEQSADALREALAGSPDDAWLIIENSAGMGAHIGASFEEVGRLADAIDSERVKVCLDTQHCFAAGYNIGDPEGVASAMAEFDQHIGLERLVAVHANDTKTELGSGVDRHGNMGEGHIGGDGFEVILAFPAFRVVPFLLEVPGVEKKGPDKANVDKLKAVRLRLGVPT